MRQLSQTQIRTTRRFLLEEFSYFAQLFIDPSFFDMTFHVELANFFQDSEKDKIIILPRGHLKTTVLSLYLLWRAVRRPDIRILIVSNTDTNAAKTVRSIRSIIEQNEMFRLFFPEVIPNFSRVRWSDSCACLARPVDHPEGTFESAGVGSNIIRRHFNVIAEDDTVAPKKDELTGDEALPTKEDIEKAVGFHKLTIPLLIDEGDNRIITCTRWASYDLANFVLDNEKFDVFDRPCRLEDGTPMYGKKFSDERLKAIRAGMGVYMFSMLYENQPLAKEFMSFNPDWFRYYEERELPEDGETIVTIDPADPPTGRKSQDFTAIISVKHTSKGLFVRRYRHVRVSDKQMIDLAFQVADEDDAYKIRIETNRYAHLVAAFREAMKIRYANRERGLIIEEVKAKRVAKEARIKNRLSPLFENGVIWLKSGMRELESELTTFPYGRHDDLIDALAWQVSDRTSTKYDRKPITRSRLPNQSDRRVFTLDEIRQSCRSAASSSVRSRYPFDRQNEEAFLAGICQ